jgi:hypothetical protein
MGNILEVEAAYNTFKKESELKSLRIVNKSVFGIGFCSRLYLIMSVGNDEYMVEFSILWFIPLL